MSERVTSYQVNRRTFLGRTLKYGAVGMAATVAPTLLTGCKDLPLPFTQSPQEKRANATEALKSYVDKVRDPNPQSLTEILANERMMFSQVGRTLQAAYKNIGDPESINVIAIRNRHRRMNDVSPLGDLWDYTFESVGRRYALAERTEDGKTVTDFIPIPDFSHASFSTFNFAFAVPEKFLIESAMEVDITKFSPNNFNEFNRILNLKLLDSRLETNTMEHPQPTVAMLRVQKLLESSFTDPFSGRPIHTSFQGRRFETHLDPVLDLVAVTNGGEKVAQVLEDAERIARQNKLLVSMYGIGPNTVAILDTYITLDIIQAAIERRTDIATDRRPALATRSNDDGFNFIRIVTPRAGRYLVYTPFES